MAQPGSDFSSRLHHGLWSPVNADLGCQFPSLLFWTGVFCAPLKTEALLWGINCVVTWGHTAAVPLQGLTFAKKQFKKGGEQGGQEGWPDNLGRVGNKAFHSKFWAVGAESRLLLGFVPYQITTWPTFSGKGHTLCCGGQWRNTYLTNPRAVLPYRIPGKRWGERSLFHWLHPASLCQELGLWGHKCGNTTPEPWNWFVI